MAGAFYQERYSYSAMSVPNFVKLADAYGAKGFRIEKAKDLARTMKEAFATPGPVLIDVVIPEGRSGDADDSAGRRDVRDAVRVVCRNLRASIKALSDRAFSPIFFLIFPKAY